MRNKTRHCEAFSVAKAVAISHLSVVREIASSEGIVASTKIMGSSR
jgi:hypothetical protein